MSKKSRQNKGSAQSRHPHPPILPFPPRIYVLNPFDRPDLQSGCGMLVDQIRQAHCLVVSKADDQNRLPTTLLEARSLVEIKRLNDW